MLRPPCKGGHSIREDTVLGKPGTGVDAFFLMQLIIRRFFLILLGVTIPLALKQSAEGRGFLS